MLDIKYCRAYTEVVEVLNHLSPEEYAKIPKEKIDYYTKNMDKDYEFKIDPKESFKEYNLSEEAAAVLISLFRDYFISKDKVEVLNDMLKRND